MKLHDRFGHRQLLRLHSFFARKAAIKISKIKNENLSESTWLQGRVPSGLPRLSRGWVLPQKQNLRTAADC